MSRSALPFLLGCLLALSSFSISYADWTIHTIAGNGKRGFSGDGGLATQAQLDNPFGVIRGPDGCIWFCEYSGQRIRRIRQDGDIETMAGNGSKGYAGDGGPALNASFNLPHEIRFDKAGNLYVVDMMNHAVRRIDVKTGIISTLAGTGRMGYSGDGGLASKAEFKQPHSIQFGPDGQLYVCDIGNHVIRRIDVTTNVITTFAGTGKAGATIDGSLITGTPLNGPRSIDFDRHGNLWLATREGNQVFKMDLKAGRIHHMAGNGKSGFQGNGGPAKEAMLKGPKGIALDSDDNVWLADTESHSVRMINAKTGNLELIAGTGILGDGPDGDPLKCNLARLHGIFVEADGSILIGDSEAHKVRVLRRKSLDAERVYLVAGGQKNAVDIPATEALLMEPFGTAFDATHQLWIVEMAAGNRLLKVDETGMLSHVAGRKELGFSGDGGPGLDAQFNGPHNLAIRKDGRVLLADTWNGRIRQVDPKTKLISSLVGFEVPIDMAKGFGPYCISTDITGTQLYIADLHRIHRLDLDTGTSTVVAGNGEKGIPKDGSIAVNAPLVDPRAVAADRLGNVYILERGGNSLRVVRSDGTITTVVNASGKKGTETSVREPGLTAMMNGPKHLCIDSLNRVIIADAENHLVRRYDPSDGTLCRVAGTGISGRDGVGERPMDCQLSRPHGVTVHPQTGELFITDSYNNRILKISEKP